MKTKKAQYRLTKSGLRVIHDPFFDKETYFKYIKDIVKDIKREGVISFARVFSDVRRERGYRTKLWFASSMERNSKLLKEIERLRMKFPKCSFEYTDWDSHKRRYPKVVIRPKTIFFKNPLIALSMFKTADSLQKDQLMRAGLLYCNRHEDEFDKPSILKEFKNMMRAPEMIYTPAQIEEFVISTDNVEMQKILKRVNKEVRKHMKKVDLNSELDILEACNKWNESHPDQQYRFKEFKAKLIEESK